MLNAARTMVALPQPIARVINAIGPLKYDDAHYIPAVVASPITQNGHTVPIPNHILLSNLRQIAVSLSHNGDPVVLLARRERFHVHNPIPGAQWDEEHFIMNVDEIMPENYGRPEFMVELHLLNPFISTLQTHAPKLAGQKIDFDNEGRISQFVSNEMGDLRVPDRELDADGNIEEMKAYLARLPYEGDIFHYMSKARLKSTDQILGQMNLLGELPPLANYIFPMYVHRSAPVAAFDIPSSYAAVVLSQLG